MDDSIYQWQNAAAFAEASVAPLALHLICVELSLITAVPESTEYQKDS